MAKDDVKVLDETAEPAKAIVIKELTPLEKLDGQISEQGSVASNEDEKTLERKMAIRQQLAICDSQIRDHQSTIDAAQARKDELNALLKSL